MSNVWILVTLGVLALAAGAALQAVALTWGKRRRMTPGGERRARRAARRKQ